MNIKLENLKIAEKNYKEAKDALDEAKGVVIWEQFDKCEAACENGFLKRSIFSKRFESENFIIDVSTVPPRFYAAPIDRSCTRRGLSFSFVESILKEKFPEYLQEFNKISSIVTL